MIKRKLLFTLIALLLVVFTLASCDWFEEDPQGPSNNNDPNGKDVVLDTIVYFDEVLSDDKLIMPVRSAMMDLVMPVVTVTDPTAPATSGEVVFGNSDRAVTQAAKQQLAALLEKDRDANTGYIIYSDGQSVAVYWMIDDMASLAISDFISICIDEQKLKVNAGVVCSEHYDKSEYEKEKYWLNLEKEAPPEIVQAYRTVYAFYDGDNLVDWVANLWDPEIGGFYYSASARDYEGFFPDIESTNFALSLLSAHGALTDRNTQLPLDMQLAILNFAKSMQSANDGYFYHKQWAQDKSQLNVDRYGRDLATATTLITSFYIDTDGDGIRETQYPNYCIPGGVKCEIHTDTDDRCTFPVEAANAVSAQLNATATLGSTVSAAVSKVNSSVVVPVASSHPDYSSATAFRKWLEEYNNGDRVKENSGNAHNIAELRLEIISHGYLDVVLDYLDDVQAEIFDEQVSAGETPTGAWQTTANFRAVWGIYKYLAIYNVSKEQSRELDLKYVPYMLDTCLTVIAAPAEEIYHVNDVMNQWTAISRIITNVGWYHGEKKAEEIQQYVRSRVTADTILGNLSKVEPFKVADGSFGYTTEGRSLSTIYGVSISLGMVEGDLNSAILATNVYKSMFTCLGYTAVPLFDSEDLDRFLDIIENCEPVEKKPLDIGTLDFENNTDMDYINSSTGSGDVIVAIEEDPEDYENNVLHFLSGQASSGRATSITIRANKGGSGCNVTEFRMLVSAETSNGWMFQCRFGTSQHYTFHRDKDEVIIKVSTDYSVGAKGTEVARFNVGEWTLLRFEYYWPDEEDGRPGPITKIFVGGEYVTSTEIYKNSDNGATASTVFDDIYIYSMASVKTDVYIDDCYLTSENLIYTEE